MTDTEQKNTSGLTEFGTELYTLALARGLRSMAQIQRRMDGAGYTISRQALASYANGSRRVPASLGRKLVKALDLTDDEQWALAWAIAYGQPDDGEA